MLSYLKIIIRYELNDIMIDELIYDLFHYACPIIKVQNIV